jgi:hypothetical protein
MGSHRTWQSARSAAEPPVRIFHGLAVNFIDRRLDLSYRTSGARRAGAATIHDRLRQFGLGSPSKSFPDVGSCCGQSSIHHQRFTGDKLGFVTGQEQRRRGDVLRLAVLRPGLESVELLGHRRRVIALTRM